MISKEFDENYKSKINNETVRFLKAKGARNKKHILCLLLRNKLNTV